MNKKTTPILFLLLLISSAASANPKPADELLSAAGKGDWDTVKRLVDGGADVNYSTGNPTNLAGITVLHFAVMSNKIDLVNYVLENRINVKKADAVSPLVLLSVGRDPEIVKALLKAGANPNAQGPEQQTPIICATEYPYANIIPLLVEYKADVNILGQGCSKYAAEMKGVTPLMRAVNRNNHEAATYLLKHKAKINAKDSKGRTALHYAKQESMKALLVKHGAKP